MDTTVSKSCRDISGSFGSNLCIQVWKHVIIADPVELQEPNHVMNWGTLSSLWFHWEQKLFCLLGLLSHRLLVVEKAESGIDFWQYLIIKEARFICVLPKFELLKLPYTNFILKYLHFFWSDFCNSIHFNKSDNSLISEIADITS